MKRQNYFNIELKIYHFLFKYKIFSYNHLEKRQNWFFVIIKLNKRNLSSQIINNNKLFFRKKKKTNFGDIQYFLPNYTFIFITYRMSISHFKQNGLVQQSVFYQAYIVIHNQFESHSCQYRIFGRAEPYKILFSLRVPIKKLYTIGQLILKHKVIPCILKTYLNIVMIDQFLW